MTKASKQGSALRRSKTWTALEKHYKEMKKMRLCELFKDENRFNTFSLYNKDCSLLLDYSKNSITPTTMQLLLALTRSAGVKDYTEKMFTGEKINFTENRAVLHIALRNRTGNPIFVDGKNARY